jgi:hypothetical protein
VPGQFGSVLEQGDETMKARKIAFLCILVMIIIVLAGVPVVADGAKTAVTGTVQVIENPASFPASKERTEGSMYYLYEWTYNRLVFTDPRLTGYMTMALLLEANMDTGLGRWGGMCSVNDDNGTLRWVGSFVGTLEFVPEGLQIPVHVNLIGVGAYRGLVANLDVNGLAGATNTGTGYIERVRR